MRRRYEPHIFDDRAEGRRGAHRSGTVHARYPQRDLLELMLRIIESAPLIAKYFIDRATAAQVGGPEPA
jgi:hypothetical protein